MRSLRDWIAGAPAAALAAALAAVVIGAGLFGFAIAELTSDDSGTSPGTEAPAVVGGSTQDNGSVPTWPPDLSAYTVVIAGHPDRAAALAAAKDARRAGLDAGIMEAARHGLAGGGGPARGRLQRHLRRTRRRGPREAARGALPGRARRARSELPVAAGHLDGVLRERVARHLGRQGAPSEPRHRLDHGGRERLEVVAALEHRADRHLELGREPPHGPPSPRSRPRSTAVAERVVAVGVEAGRDQHQLGPIGAAERHDDVLEQRQQTRPRARRGPAG